MSRRLKQKWRPPLAFVIGGTLAVVPIVPLIGIAIFKLEGHILGWGETSWLLGWLALISTGILGFLLWRLVLRPVWALTDYARALQRGHAPINPESFGTPELHDLAQAVTDMGTTLSGRATQLRAYANHVTHELKSPLTALRGSAELLQNQPDEKTRDELVKSIDAAAARMEQLLGDLQRHARASQSAGSGEARLKPIADSLNFVCDSDTILPLVEADLHAVLAQLAQNARNHGAKTITLKVGEGWLDVTDDGAGIAPGDRERIFDTFFTTRREAGGTGMGLSIVRSLLHASGADISLLDTQKGASFRITFPQ